MELKDYITEELRGRLQSGGELPCKLTLPALAKHYGVSLTPVRGAVAQLLAEASLEKLPNGRLGVAIVSGSRGADFAPSSLHQRPGTGIACSFVR